MVVFCLYINRIHVTSIPVFSPSRSKMQIKKVLAPRMYSGMIGRMSLTVNFECDYALWTTRKLNKQLTLSTEIGASCLVIPGP